MTTNKDMTCRIVRPDSTFAGKQGLTYAEGISAESVGSKAICMHVLTMPPGARAKAHLHENHETAIYMLAGEADTWYGARLEHRDELTAMIEARTIGATIHRPVTGEGRSREVEPGWGLAAAIGALGALYPAWRASRMNVLAAIQRGASPYGPAPKGGGVAAVGHVRPCCSQLRIS